MKGRDLKLAVGFLEAYSEQFELYLEGEHEIDGSEAGVIIDEMSVAADVLEMNQSELKPNPAADTGRLCPHDEVHDRIRSALGYVRDRRDNDRSVCALCWLENETAGFDRFHSPHGCAVTMLFSILVLPPGEVEGV